MIMKFLAKKILVGNLKKLGKTALNVVDHTVLGGAVSKTKGTDHGAQNQPPYLEIAASLIPIGLLVALFAGWIDIEELTELLKLF